MVSKPAALPLALLIALLGESECLSCQLAEIRICRHAIRTSRWSAPDILLFFLLLCTYGALEEASFLRKPSDIKTTAGSLATIASAANPKIEEDGSIKDLIEKVHKNGKTECDFTQLLELVEALPRDGEDNDDFYVLFNKKAQDYDAAEGENSVFFAPTNQAALKYNE
eukprot:1155796-Pelagomonas_calceolata.AAC.1